MITRKEYMSKKATHEEYYGQFVNDSVVRIVKRSIGEDRIKNSTDEHFNDISLDSWDRLHGLIHNVVGKEVRLANGSGGYSLSDSVCVAKAAARQIKNAR